LTLQAAAPGTGLGLVLPKGPGPVAEWPRAAAAFAQLESDGCSAIWLTDHLFFPVNTPDALTMAAVAASATNKCLIGTGVIQLPLRQVAAVAKSSSTLSALSGGRFVLGVGIGEHSEEYERAGATFRSRGIALDRGIAELRDLWSPGDSWFEQHPAAPDIPIWVGGRSERSLQRTAEQGDGWFPMFISASGFARRSTQLDELLVGAGRDPTSLQRAVLVIASVNSPQWSADDARSWATNLFRADPQAMERHVITGSAHQVASALAAFRDAGAQHVAVLIASDEPLKDYKSLAEQWG
jgi:alkanesulfonate monooxygenase SsuD/methylene tetrahydromethanopterin reductase-like flavin-dependent oxidoreductase (luciferase family)